MKKKSSAVLSIFAGAAVVGSLFVGSLVGAQSVSTTASTTLGASTTVMTSTTGSFPTVGCSFAPGTAMVGQTITFAATGGDGSYIWSSPSIAVSNPTGPTFVVNFTGAGTYPVTVTSNGTAAVCTVTITAVPNMTGGSVTGTPTPGLPNAGEPAY